MEVLIFNLVIIIFGRHGQEGQEENSGTQRKSRTKSTTPSSKYLIIIDSFKAIQERGQKQ